MGLFSKKSNEDADNTNTEKPIEIYKVNYRGGHPDYPKAKAGAIIFQLFSDRFELEPTIGSKWFSPLIIPFSMVNDFKIVGNQVGTVVGILGGLNSRQLNQDNNININYLCNGQNILLRLEMLTGVSVMGQAVKCKELEDRLNTHEIRQKLLTAKPVQSNGNSGLSSVADELTKLAKLKEKGIITQTEFDNEKSKLMGR